MASVDGKCGRLVNCAMILISGFPEILAVKGFFF